MYGMFLLSSSKGQNLWPASHVPPPHTDL